MQYNLSPGWRQVCNSPSEGTLFRQGCQSRPEQLGVLMETRVVADEGGEYPWECFSSWAEIEWCKEVQYEAE